MARIQAGLYAGLSREDGISLDSVQGLAAYFYLTDRAGLSAVDLVAPPVVANPGFDVDADWTKGAWTIAGGVATRNTVEAAGQTISQTVGVAGTRPEISWDQTRRVSGGTCASVSAYSPYIIATGRHTQDATATSANWGIGSAGNSDLDIDNVSMRNLSVTRWRDRLDPTHGLEQAAPTLVPWLTPEGIRYLAGEDRNASSRAAAAWAFTHRPESASMHALIPHALADAHICGTITDGSTPGMLLSITATGAIRARVADGAGAADYIVDATSAAGIAVVSAPLLVGTRWGQGGNFEVWANGARIIDAAPARAASAADPAVTLQQNSNAAGAAGIGATRAASLFLRAAPAPGKWLQMWRRLRANLQSDTGQVYTWTS